MPPRRGAGGETGDQALEVLGGGGELLHERGEEGVAGEAAGDQGEQAGQDRPDARSEFGGVGVGRRCRRRLHGPILTRSAGRSPEQTENHFAWLTGGWRRSPHVGASLARRPFFALKGAEKDWPVCARRR